MSTSAAAAAALRSSSTLASHGVSPAAAEATASPAAVPGCLFTAPPSSSSASPASFFGAATRQPLVSPTAAAAAANPFPPSPAAAAASSSSASLAPGPSSASACPSSASSPSEALPGASAVPQAAAAHRHLGNPAAVAAAAATGGGVPPVGGGAPGGAAPAASTGGGPAAAAAPFPLQVMQQLLLSTLDPRQAVREQAEQQLLAAKARDFHVFLVSLALLIDEELPAAAVPGLAAAALQEQVLAKQVAAVAFKNSISAKDALLDSEAADKWRSLPEDSKQRMRLQLLGAIKTEHTQVANAVCQVLSKIARIELPTNNFPELLPSLLALVTEATLPGPRAAAAASQGAEGGGEAAAAADATAAAVQRSKTYGRNALTCLSYLCEEHADIVQETGEDPSAVLSNTHCNSILTAVVQGMKDEDIQLKIAALKALYHALIFARQNFLNPTERTYIIEAVVENTKPLAVPVAVQVAACECLVNIAQEYYELLEPYMPVVAPLSWQALAEGEDSICIAAVELWNTLADIEIEIQTREKEQQQHQALAAAAAAPQQQQQAGSASSSSSSSSCASSAAGAAADGRGGGEQQQQAGGGQQQQKAGAGGGAGGRGGGEAEGGGGEPGEEEGPLFQRRNCHIIQQALPFLLPILLQRLTHQKSEELDAADSWTPAMAAGTCLSLCAQVVGDEILPPVVEFVSSHFRSDDWTQREAAVFAFGSIMHGPSTAALSPLIDESFASLVAVLQDPSVAVRDTAAWTLGRIASFHASVILNKLLLPSSAAAPGGAAAGSTPGSSTTNAAGNANANAASTASPNDGTSAASSEAAAAAAAAADVAAAAAAAAAAGTPLSPEQQQLLRHERLQFHLLQQQQQQQESPLLAAIVARLADKPRVAAHICWMLEQIASQLTPPLQEKDRSSNSSIDPFFEKLCSALIAVAERPDADEKGLREAAFTALASLIGCAGNRCKPAMMQMLDHFVNQLAHSFSFEQNDATRQRQGLICGAIQVLCSRLGGAIKPAAPQIWKPISMLFRAPGGGGGRSSSSSTGAAADGRGGAGGGGGVGHGGTAAAEAAGRGRGGENEEGVLLSCSSSDLCTNDALLATSSLVRAAGEAALPFAEEVVAVVASGLSGSSTRSAAGSSGGAAGAAAATAGSTTTDELQTVRICVELIGDLSAAIGVAFAAFTSPLLSTVYHMLQDPTVERTLKPSIMTAVGDVAINVGGESFLPFLEPFMVILHQAGDTPYDVGPSNWQENVDWLWYIHDLRESVMSAYMSIIYSMKEQHLQQVLKPYVSSMLEVVKAVAATNAKMRGVGASVNQALDLIFDLATTYGADLSVHLEQAPFVEQLVHLAEALAAAGDPLGQSCVTRARWVRDVLSRVSHAAAPLPPAQVVT